ncbi:membrane insertase OXA1 [Aspergillus stella-maris]|uniref:membrane insertase OXA1 n=1 Tax=Aspergillus stella-maris TaxID=1810926 RepID=UPI003CCD16A5
MLAGPSITGRIAQRQFAAFARSSRSMSSFGPQISRIQPVQRGSRILGGQTAWKASIPSIVFGSARFNSTSSSTSSEFVPETSAQSTEWEPSKIDINSIPEHTGYLKDMGLDYGWGPTAFMEWMVEHVHIYSGLPWVASIVAAGFVARALMLPLFIKSADQGARAANSAPILQPVRLRMFAAMRVQNQMEMAQAKAELAKINNDLGLRQRWVFAPMLVQFPLGYGVFRLVRGMCSLPVPALSQEQFAWITDFTATDPYFILPLAAAVVMHFTLRKGGEVGPMANASPALRRSMWYGLPLFSILFIVSQPAALQLYFLTTGVLGLGQAHLFRSTSFRKMVGMTQFEPRKPSSPDQPNEGTKIRMLNDFIAREKAKMPETPARSPADVERQKVSVIDQAMNSIKKTGREIGKEAQKKMDEMRGKGPATNPDGTPAAPPRLSDKDRRLAADYEKRRREEEDWKREERNHARRQEYLREQEKQRAQAKSAINKNTR